MCLMSYANNKGADQTLDSIAEISRLYLASVDAQAGLCLAWTETPEDTFCCVMAHLFVRLKMMITEYFALLTIF